MNQRSYDAKDGRKVSVVEVICDSVQFLESKNSNTASREDTGYTPDIVPDDVEEKNTSSIDVADDDLPF